MNNWECRAAVYGRASQISSVHLCLVQAKISVPRLDSVSNCSIGVTWSMAAFGIGVDRLQAIAFAHAHLEHCAEDVRH